MAFTVEAVYEDGVLKPVQPRPFQEHEKVRLTVQPVLSRARQTAGLLRWEGDPALLERFILDPELDPSEGSWHSRSYQPERPFSWTPTPFSTTSLPVPSMATSASSASEDKKGSGSVKWLKQRILPPFSLRAVGASTDAERFERVFQEYQVRGAQSAVAVRLAFNLFPPSMARCGEKRGQTGISATATSKVLCPAFIPDCSLDRTCGKTAASDRIGKGIYWE